MKECTKCKVEKESSEFHKYKASKDGLYPQCKPCRKEWAQENKEKINQYRVQYVEENRDEISERKAKYREENREVINARARESQTKKRRDQGIKEFAPCTLTEEEKKERARITTAKWLKENREKAKAYIDENKERLNQQKRYYYNINRDALLAKRREKHPPKRIKLTEDERKRRRKAAEKKRLSLKWKTDPVYRATQNMRNRIREAVKMQKGYKIDSSVKLLGCTVREFRSHLEKQFKKGMNWDNYGITGWHIDHVIPVASFDLSDPIQQRQCFHYTNLQPLWAMDNIRKSDKIIQPIQMRIAI